MRSVHVVCACTLALARAATAGPCAEVDAKAPITVATAALASEYALTIEVDSASATSWGKTGNEALVLDVSGAHRGLIGNLIVHQGPVRFEYAMHVGALAAGEALQVKVSSLSAPAATPRATACNAKLVPVSALGDAAEGVTNAPEFRWPVQKSFDDVPLVVGWSKSHKSYTTVMTNENGGTAEICGGGARGMQAEIARWGRSLDIEDHYKYGEQKWERCTKGGATLAEVPLRMEGAHPIIYWGNGHNKVFENRGGYGHACGAGKPEKADGDLAGWNVKNPSNELADDPGRVIILRPLPVDLDAVGYDHSSGRREALADHYAPWIYRLSSLELAREGKIDDAKTLGLDRYLYVDVEVADVGGEGDSYCTPIVRGGFKLRAITTAGTAISSPQITKAYAGGGHRDWKRVAIALPAGVHAADITGFVFDAYDKDGIYVTGLGDAFVPRAVGDNGATLDYVRRGVATFTDYIDDDRSTCAAGKITYEGTDYRCMGGQVQLVGR